MEALISAVSDALQAKCGTVVRSPNKKNIDPANSDVELLVTIPGYTDPSTAAQCSETVIDAIRARSASVSARGRERERVCV